MMKTIARMWMVTIALGIWLLPIQSAQAVDIRNCHLLHSNNLHPQVAISSLSNDTLSQLKVTFVADQTGASMNESKACFRVSGQVDLTACDDAIAANLANEAEWNNLGQKLFRLERYPDALIAYDHALLINPDYSLELANRCGVLSKLEQYDQALKSCDLALEGDGYWGVEGAALAWDNRGDVLFNLERYQESLNSFEQALAINPSYKHAQQNRAIALYQLDSSTNH